MANFRETLHQQRWDDHRLYHHSLVNQSLHFFSATTFVCCYVLLLFDPGIASFIAWTLAMASRQSGHFFFEPKGYDSANQVTHKYKEEVKTGYNLFRKWILMGIWMGSPLLLVLSPTLLGLFKPSTNWVDVIRHIGYIWLILGGAAVFVRVVQLYIAHDLLTGVAWATKVLTDPFSDIKLYHNSPMRLLRGERLDHGLMSDQSMPAQAMPEPQV
jgi:hypothetical protein